MNPEDRNNISIENKFKLSTTLNTSNMVLFNLDGKLKKFNNVVEIFEEFYLIRLKFYEKRKDYVCSKLEREI